MSDGKLLLALDLGTTTLAGRLLARDGTVLAESRRSNPQAQLGSDVIRRLEAALCGEAERLQQLLVAGVQTVLSDLLQQGQREPSDIEFAAAAANPAVTLLLCGGDPRPVLFPPHRPRDFYGKTVDPRSFGLDLDAPIYLFPLVSGYVGGDLVAFVYGQMDALPGDLSVVPGQSTLYVDIGTNAEMALSANDRWWATSVAAGPAFEGGGIAHGMPAETGAIADVRLDGDRLQLDVLGEAAPRGICGSGVAAAVAVGLEGGLIDRTGRILAPEEMDSNLARYLVAETNGNALRLYRDARIDLCLSQADVRAFQLAKGALLAGVDCLLERAKIAPEEVGRVVMTGAFGLHLTPSVLKRVALLPQGMVKKTSFVPGGALEGVCRCLTSTDGLVKAQGLARLLNPYPLSGTPMFETAFLKGLDF